MNSKTKPKSGFVNPMMLVQEVHEKAGTEPLQLAPQAAGEAVKAPALASPTSSSPLTQTPEGEELPWVNANPRVRVHFGLRMSERLHLKFQYAATHTLGHSMQTYALQALEEAVDRRLKELGVL